MTPMMALTLLDGGFRLVNGFMKSWAEMKAIRMELEKNAISEDEAKRRVDAIFAHQWDDPIPGQPGEEP